jgi:putative NADPH-quinone reductase
MKTLVVVAHPDIETSVINKAWLEELRKYPELYTVHELYNVYPDWQIDVAQEQKLIEAHEKFVLQFPVFWFSSPPLLKKWLDDVLTYGWAYGSGSGYKMQNRKVALAVTAGIKEQDYSSTGRYKYSLDEILLPFEITTNYVNATYGSYYAFYGTESASDVTAEQVNNNEVARSVVEYRSFIAALD